MFKTYYIHWIILIFFSSLYSFSQTNSKYTIVDFDNKKPLAFANIIFNDNKFVGTTTDIDGVFFIDKDKVQTLTISHLGYETKSINLNAISDLTISLKKDPISLDEVVLNPNENPAIPIIKKVIANKELNNPENINSFSFTSYNKVVLDSNTKDNDTINEFLKDKYLFITETLSKRKYLKPNFVEDSIIATRVSGLKEPIFSVLSTDFQPFSFYNEYINLIGINYLNPISNGSLKKYDFVLEETFQKENDTIYVISFKPQKNKNFDGLKGVFYINSNRYAVQNIDAEPSVKQKTTIKIQQQYTFIDDSYWFPEQLNFIINVGVSEIGLKYIGKSYITDILPNAPLTKKDFPFETVTFKKRDVVKDSTFWGLHRTDTLDIREKRTYKFIDSIGNEVNFDKYINYLEALDTGMLSFNYVDLDINQLVNFNKYEGTRLGVGLYTNDDLIENISFGGYAGYGFRDHTWKYGFKVNAILPTRKDVSFSLSYDNTLREAGKSIFHKYGLFSSARDFISENMDHIEAVSLQSKMKLVRNLYWTFDFRNTKTIPKYNYAFIDNNQIISNYTNTSFTAKFEYYFNEKVVTYFGGKMRIDSNDPVINLTYSRGLKSLLNGNFNYNKFVFSLDHTFTITNLGVTTYRLESGYIDNSLPYGLLFTGEGSYDKKFPFFMKNYFQTLQPYEFLSDKYVNLFTYHNFGGLLFKTGNFQPDILWHNNVGIGNLTNTANHLGVPFATKDRWFLETGLEMKNLIKVNYLDMANFGFGAGAFYRYGYHALPDSGDNLVFKFNFSFTFK